MNIDFNSLITDTGMLVWILAGLAVGFIIMFFPIMLQDWMHKREKQFPYWIEKHIVLVQIIWVAVLFLAVKILGSVRL